LYTLYPSVNWLFRKRYIQALNSAKRLADYGNKANNLRRMKRLGARVPPAWVCSASVYQEWQSGEKKVETQLRQELSACLNPSASYAVRSSSVMEDGEHYSFAGQFDSHLNLKSIDDILAAIKSIWESATGDRVKSYMGKTDFAADKVGMAIIIQEMVPSKLAGVVFTCNPMTGLNETIVEAVAGSGETLMQKGVTPLRWIYKWDKLVERPQQGDSFTAVVQQVADSAKYYEQKYRRPLDLEWVWDGQDIFWLQARAITSIRGINVYSNRISREFMPGMIKPLIWSINTMVVNTAWKRLLHELIGRQAENIDINHLAKSFYYRSYFNMGIIGDVFELLGMPRESLELLMGIEVSGSLRPKFKPGLKALRFVPSILGFILDKISYKRRLERDLKVLSSEYEQFSNRNLENLEAPHLLAQIDELIKVNIKGSYHVIISRILASFYDILAKKAVETQDIEQFNGEIKYRTDSEINPAYQFEILKQSFLKLPAELAKNIVTTYQTDNWNQPFYHPFKTAFESFIKAFGHLSDSGNDFSQIQWRENPQFLLKMLAKDTSPSRIKPFNKSAALRLSIKKLNLSQKSILKLAMEYRYLRARANYVYEYGYGLFRNYCLSTGRLIVNQGKLDDKQDIFYLSLDELKNGLSQPSFVTNFKNLVFTRKNEAHRYANLILPELIIGEDLPIPSGNVKLNTKLKGVAVSRGYHEGLTRIVRGSRDFDRVNSGDVIVIPYSDISWTPVLSQAGAIISESGGMLSHCSIVAREYGIPAVVSVNNAMTLTEGTRVAVDGLNGEITYCSPITP
jgi:phosphohistidine swiveling domain-containing protein